MRNITMKKYFIYIIFFTFGSSLGQDKKPKRILTQQGEIIKFEEYHDNGILSQTGYFLDGKNHGIWMSYNSQGIRLSKGVYDKGKKTDEPVFHRETTRAPRGGNWLSVRSFSRITTRLGLHPNLEAEFIGFRLVKNKNVPDTMK